MEVKREKILHLGVAFVLAAIAALAVFGIHQSRDFWFEWDWVEPNGTLVMEEDAALKAAALAFMEKNAAGPGQVCLEKWIARDERYLYLAIGCADFTERLGEIRADGDQNYRAVRLRYNEKEIEKLDRPDEDNFSNSLRRYFPKQAAHRLMSHLNAEEFRRRGLQKQGR